ncbi:hypothetical protein ACMFMG_001126 [Clarireedia jacksonii]
MCFACGQEKIIDGVKVIAKTASSQGVQIAFREYEGMPHTFMWQLPEAPQSEHCWKAWAYACRSIVRGANDLTSQRIFINVDGTKVHGGNLEHLTPLTRDKTSQIIKQGANRYKQFTGKYASL